MDRVHPHYVEAIRYLYDRLNYEKSTDKPYNKQNYRLARMDALLSELGRPNLRVPVIHIAGTKGKGSVSWLIAETLRYAGKRVGLYTSPHLVQLEERFVVDASIASTESIVTLLPRIAKAAEKIESKHGQATFFELTTALAWCHFEAQDTEVNVIEVGLGGRLDSTNVCQSLLSIITSISFDHQAQLGNTLEAIATEKAGIIKPGAFVIHGVRPSEARDVIRNQAEKCNCGIWELGRDFEVKRNSPAHGQQSRAFDFTPLSEVSEAKVRGLTRLPAFELKMLGSHQSENAAVAIAACQKLIQLGWQIPTDAMRRALSSTQVACRIEVVQTEPLTIVDAAHNIASMTSLLQTLRESFSPAMKTVVFSSSKDKEYQAMLELIMGYADRVILTQYSNNPRFVPVEKLASEAELLHSKYPAVEVLTSPNSEIAMQYAASNSSEKELICYTGSFFLASEVRPAFE
ncbi:MAG: bifunctional folylpolyglutamate synthase/dihydrofolate synthase [Pirellula sp.]|jgi:dihydrofolate synthase/folylpolyglutamate synthase|nr:bifunctional folylpolyglutamate synthase/dihydrofolate synthase [Pirellula sp.]